MHGLYLKACCAITPAVDIEITDVSFISEGNMSSDKCFIIPVSNLQNSYIKDIIHFPNHLKFNTQHRYVATKANKYYNLNFMSSRIPKS